MCEPGLDKGKWDGTQGLRGCWGSTYTAEVAREDFLSYQPGPPSHTSKKADVVLLCGDLNMHPRDLGCCLLKEYTGLHDAYLETQDFKVRTCLFPAFSALSCPHILLPPGCSPRALKKAAPW